MPTKYLYGLFLAGGFFLQLNATAQGVTDSLEYRQAKLNIWCETIQFVYQDYGADSLNERLDCHSWESFREGLKDNNLQVNTFFQSIEKPAIYQGYSTYDAKLQKLTSEITRKLKSSSSRISDSVRLRKVDRLQENLMRIAATTPEITVPPRQETIVPDDKRDIIQNNQEAVVINSEEQTTLPVEEENTMDWIEIAQWALLLLLTAGLILLWVKNRKLENELNQRMKRRKQEISAITRLRENAAPPPVLEKPQHLGKDEVQNIVHAEIEKIRQQQKISRQQQAEKARNVGKRQEQPERHQQPVNPPANNQGLVSESVRPVPKEEEKPEAGIYYDKLPFKGGFHQSQLSTHRNPDSTYSIQVLTGRPDEAEFWVTEDQEVQKYAMQNGLSFFEEACEYNQVEENPSRVRNLEKGKLRKNGNLWQIEKKVKVTFE